MSFLHAISTNLVDPIKQQKIELAIVGILLLLVLIEPPPAITVIVSAYFLLGWLVPIFLFFLFTGIGRCLFKLTGIKWLKNQFPERPNQLVQFGIRLAYVLLLLYVSTPEAQELLKVVQP